MAILTVGLLIDLRWLAIFGSACMLHITLDLPFHADDAHQHFWPLTEWRFHSPLSYWDTDYHAAYVRVLEIAAALAMVFVLWRRHTARWVKAALAVTFALYAAVPVYFISTLG